MGGGIMPVAMKNNTIYFLLGLENEYNDTPGWADFGGGAKKGENMLETSLREGGEELNGFLGSGSDLKRLVTKNKIITLQYEKYASYLFQIPYDENLPLYFNNNFKFMKNNLKNVVKQEDNGLLEKSEIKWFSLDQIKREKKYRPFFKNIINLLVKNYQNVKKKIKKKPYLLKKTQKKTKKHV